VSYEPLLDCFVPETETFDLLNGSTGSRAIPRLWRHCPEAALRDGRILTLPPELVGRDSVEPLQRSKFSGSGPKQAKIGSWGHSPHPSLGGSVKMRPSAIDIQIAH